MRIDELIAEAMDSDKWDAETWRVVKLVTDHDDQMSTEQALALGNLISRLGTGVTDEQALADEILAELTRARTEFPGKNVTFAALVEEVGELATATFEESRERVRKEAVQVATMAMRMVLDGDHTFDGWRAEKGLDPLTTPSSEVRNG